MWIATLKRCFSPTNTQETEPFEYSLPSNAEVTVGRDSGCQIIIQYQQVSRYHAKIQTVGNNSQIQWQVCDLSSTNGTYINDVRLQGCRILQLGDRITFSKGGPEFIFECQEIAEPVPVNEVIIQNNKSATQQVKSASTFETQGSFQTEPSSDYATKNLPDPLSSVTTAPSPFSLWNLATNEKLFILTGHTDSVRSLAFSSDAKTLASGGADKTIKLWDINTREEIQTISGHKLAVSAVTFSTTGKILASGSADKTIKLWNLHTKEEIRTLIGHTMGVTALAFNPNGKILASGGADKSIKLWDVATGKEICTFSGHKMVVNALSFSPDGQVLLSGSADKTVKVWKLNTEEEILTLPIFRSAVNFLMFEQNGQTLAIACDDKTIKLWNFQQMREIRSILESNWQMGCITISQDGQWFACSEDKTIKVWAIY